MVLRELERTACFAWSKQSSSQLLATGTKVGALSDDFSSETKLELWDLGLDRLDAPADLKPLGSISTDSGFNDIAWSEPSDEHPLGVIAGALENGSIDLWDAEKLRKGASDAFISRTTKHSGPAKALQWNPHRHSLLASVGAKGEVYIYDLSNMSNPFKLGAAAARADDIECLDWNKQEKTAHILATGSTGGFVTVWDVKQKRDILTLNNQGRKAVSAVAWDPEESTKLATATPNDQDPAIYLWSLRNSSAPERTLKGHELGVLGLAWCQQDTDLLLSCGKDNRTICWNPKTGERYGDFTVGSNWAFQTRWNPHNPGLIASASFDGKVLITTTQSGNKKSDDQAQTSQALDGEDFFATAQSEPRKINFSIPKAPKWLARPSNISFGFGGKLVRVALDSSRKSTVSISSFSVDSTIGESASKFEEQLKAGDVASICSTKIADAKTDEEKADWQVIDTLNAGSSRKKLREYLGFADESDDLATKTEKLAINGDAEAKDAVNGDKGDDDFFGGAEGDDFLANLAASKGTKMNNPFSVYSGSESDADKGITRALMLGQFEKALDICLESSDDRLADAFMIAVCGGQACIDKAQSAYLKKKGKAGQGPNYLRLLASVVGKNLWDVVHNADLKDWKDVMATLCTYADGSEFSDLCEALGDRLEEAFQESPSSRSLRSDASFCYLAGSKLEKVVNNWTQELQENEKAAIESSTEDNDFSVHAKCLQDFIEKVAVFRKVTNFQDPQLQATEEWKLAPLYNLYSEYAEILAAHGQLATAERYLALLPTKFAGAEVAQQRISQATRKAGASTQRQPAATTVRAPGMVPSVAQPTVPAVQPLINQARNATPGPYAPAAAVPAAASPYAPVGAAAPAPNAYAPPGYQPTTSTPYGQPGYAGYSQPGVPAAAIPPPPRMGTSSPSVPLPSAAKNMTNWNDMPDNFIKERQPNSRRGTPGPTPISSPFPNAAPPSAAPPPPGPYGMAKPSNPLPPPPKAGEMAHRVASPISSPPPAGEARPSSSAATAYAPPQPPSNQYAPPQPPVGSTLPTPSAAPIARGASPYQPPPSTSTAPPNSRYAPAPGVAPSPAPGAPFQQRPIAPNPYGAPPPGPYGAPAPGPYASQPPAQPSPYGQPPPSAARATGPPPRAGPPPSGPPRSQQATPSGPPPPSGPPRNAAPPPSNTSQPPLPQSAADAQSSGAPPAPSSTSKPKHPRGDRSHISANAQPIVDILTPEVARIKAVAPQAFKPQVDDMEKRINILFDHLNNQDLLSEATIAMLVEISRAVQGKEWDRAQAVFGDLQREKSEEGGVWIVGIKRLIAIGKATK